MLMATSKRKNLLIGVFVTLALVGLVFLVQTSKEKPITNARTTDGRPVLSLVGAYVCIPHRDTSGLQTEECVEGIETEEGKHYVIDFVPAPGSFVEPPRLGERVSVTGYFTPAMALSSDRWMRYDFEGIVSVAEAPHKI